MRPLEGIRVIEAASYISGPFAGAILADLGADVTKVEPKGKGDPYRNFGTRYGDSSLFFKAVNQNKTSVFLDLKDESDLVDFRSLLIDADVLITNWRPAVAKGFGLDVDVVRTLFPQLVWVRVSGYGQHGPRADMPAYDSIIQSRTGGLRAESDEPQLGASLLADKVSAMSAAQAASAALIQRSRTGEGAIVDLAMIDAMAYFNGADISAGHRIVYEETDTRVIAQLDGNKPFRTADSWLILAPVSGKQLRRALATVGKPDAWDDLISRAGDGDLLEHFAEVMAPELERKTTAEWEAAFDEADVPASAVLTIEEHMASEQVVHNATYTTIDEPGVGAFLRVRTPALFDDEPVKTAGIASPPLPN